MSPHNTRPAEGSPEELIWLRGYEAGVIDMRSDAKASGWRDIESDPPDETRDVVLCWEPAAFDGIDQLGPARYYVSSGYALNNQYKCGTEDQDPTHWQPLLPPPGEEDGDDVDTIYQHAHRASVRSTIATSMKREEALNLMKLGFDEVVRHKDDQLEALRAENAELKAVARDVVDLITEAFAEHKAEKIAVAQDRLRSALSPQERDDE